jgi:hypothetical protein
MRCVSTWYHGTWRTRGDELPALPARPSRVWTAEQPRGFLAHVADDRWAPMWRLLATTAMHWCTRPAALSGNVDDRRRRVAEGRHATPRHAHVSVTLQLHVAVLPAHDQAAADAFAAVIDG